LALKFVTSASAAQRLVERFEQHESQQLVSKTTRHFRRPNVKGTSTAFCECQLKLPVLHDLISAADRHSVVAVVGEPAVIRLAVGHDDCRPAEQNAKLCRDRRGALVIVARGAVEEFGVPVALVATALAWDRQMPSGMAAIATWA
jgi:hypothetical protein